MKTYHLSNSKSVLSRNYQNVQTYCQQNRILLQWNPVNTDTNCKRTGQIVRINGVSVLNGVSEKMSRLHVLSTQRRRQTFLRQQNVLLYCYCNKLWTPWPKLIVFTKTLRSCQTLERNFNKLSQQWKCRNFTIYKKLDAFQQQQNDFYNFSFVNETLTVTVLKLYKLIWKSP